MDQTIRKGTIKRTIDKIKNSYKKSKSIYDGVLTQNSFWSRLYIRLFWSDVDDNKIAEDVLSYISDVFSDRLSGVPMGMAINGFHAFPDKEKAFSEV